MHPAPSAPARAARVSPLLASFALVTLLPLPLAACGGGGRGGDSTAPLDVDVETFFLDDARAEHTVTRLANDDLLIAGGRSLGGGALASAEVFDASEAGGPDPVVSTDSMDEPRARHTATRLPSGNVVAIGGTTSAAVEEYAPNAGDPALGVWTTAPVAALLEPRRRHAAALLLDGRVLVVGGEDSGGTALASAELYAGPGVAMVAAAPMSVERVDPTATTLPDGRVLVAGGFDATGAPLASAELYDPLLDSWAPAGNDMDDARGLHRAVWLPAGARVLIAGGADADGFGLRSTELFDPATDAFSPGGDVAGPGVFAHSLTLLGNGEAAVAGGFTEGGADAFAEPVRETAVYAFGSGEGVGAQDVPGRRGFHASEAVPSPGPAGSDLVVVGGYDEDGDARDTVFVLRIADEAEALADTLSTPDLLALGTFLTAFHLFQDGLSGFGDVDLRVEEDPVFGTFVTGHVGSWFVDLEVDAGQVVGEVEGKDYVLRVDDDLVTAPDLQVDFRPATRVEGDMDVDFQDFDFDVDRDADTFDGFLEGESTEAHVFVEVDGDETDASSFLDVYFL
jgi:hypothetical protein